ncbi:hypothetical protein ACMFMG_001123 [Clarireedia jacksonii]
MEMSTTDGEQLAKIETLQRYGIGASRAIRVANDDLKEWGAFDIDNVLRQVQWSESRDHNPCGPEFNQYRRLGIGLRTFFYSCLGLGLVIGIPTFTIAGIINVVKKRKLSVFKESWAPVSNIFSLFWTIDGFVKAPLSLLRQSIEQKAALCVNKAGKFKILTSGYTIMSHVWEETMGWNSPSGFGNVDLSLRKKGISHGHFIKFFERCNSTWLWVDILAMPEVLEDMNEEEKSETEALRAGVINNLNSIYQQAEKIVVLDSLTMQLKTGSLLDVAVVLSVGRWITRTSSVAEANLGKKVIIKTLDGQADLDEIARLLEELTTDEGHRYYRLMRRFSTLRGVSANTPLKEHNLVEAYQTTCAERDF